MIRRATKHDLPRILDLLRNYRSATPWARLGACDNETHITKLLTYILAGQGVIFVAERDSQIQAQLVAVKNASIWDPDLYLMQELAYWVEPEYRGSTMGYRLIAAYRDHCEQLKTQEKIDSYTISKMVNSPDLNYAKFGFEKLEESWRA
jgi:N-acetylglutamate synthase-like GNAT family acetyltransferase